MPYILNLISIITASTVALIIARITFSLLHGGNHLLDPFGYTLFIVVGLAGTSPILMIYAYIDLKLQKKDTNVFIHLLCANVLLTLFCLLFTNIISKSFMLYYHGLQTASITSLIHYYFLKEYFVIEEKDE